MKCLTSRRTGGRLWPLTKKECQSQTPAHRLQLIVPERGGHSQLCVLCGTMLVRAPVPPRTASWRAA
jgi:hypothetical protein